MSQDRTTRRDFLQAGAAATAAVSVPYFFSSSQARAEDKNRLNGRVKMPNRYNVAESFDCHLTLPNGNTINLTSKMNELVISGERGRIRVNRGSLTGKPVEEIESNPVDRDWLEQEVTKLYRGMPISPTLPHMSNFFHCIESRQKPIADVWTHCNSVNVCHVANISMLVKRQLSFDDAEYRSSDEQANRFIARQQRSPWGFGS